MVVFYFYFIEKMVLTPRMGDIKPLLSYFDITSNDEINNVVFAPKDYFIKRFVENGENFRDKKW